MIHNIFKDLAIQTELNKGLFNNLDSFPSILFQLSLVYPSSFYLFVSVSIVSLWWTVDKYRYIYTYIQIHIHMILYYIHIIFKLLSSYIYLRTKTTVFILFFNLLFLPNNISCTALQVSNSLILLHCMGLA
jgi:hypothetical protein